jgi:hypothetical protein
MTTILILGVPTLIGTNARTITLLAHSVSATCAFCDSPVPQVQIIGEDARLAPVLRDIKSNGIVLFEGTVTSLYPILG